MENPKISIIVPVYKVEKYLERCIESILQQTYRNIEIILVDDGSPDNCPEICDKFAKMDKRIQVIHKPNGGVSSARNAGLEAATGEYIGFADSDDWIEKEMYESLLNTILETGTSVSVCASKKLENGRIIDNYIGTNQSTLTKESLLENSFRVVRKKAHSIKPQGIMMKLYKKDLWDDLRFDETMPIGEDFIAWLGILTQIDECGVCDKPLYTINFHNDSSYASKSLIERSTGDYLTAKKCIKIAQSNHGILPYAVEHLITISFMYLDALAKNKDFKRFMACRKYLMSFWKEIKTSFLNYTIKYKAGICMLKYIPHVFYLVIVYRMTKGKWKAVE